MKATYIPVKNPENASEERVQSLYDLLQLLDNFKHSNFKNSPEFQKGIKKLNIDQVRLCITELQKGAEPEKLAACLARYSRSNDGIEYILEKFADKSPDQIFKFVDYGHASIGGLTGGIAIAIDQVTMIMAYKLFEFAQMADGQEASTRYITLTKEGLPDPFNLGIPDEIEPLWSETCEKGFQLYTNIFEELDKIATANPETIKLPEKAKTNEKMRERILKNYALDRSRYFLPFATLSNVAIVATARIWAETTRLIESLQWKEAIELATHIRVELNRVAPNLVRHSYADNASIAFVRELQIHGSDYAATQFTNPDKTATCHCRLDIFDPQTQFLRFNSNKAQALQNRKTRYSHTGIALKRQTVQTEWSAMAIAELRDLNRHRTGFRFSDFAPKGFYLPPETDEILCKDVHKPSAKTFFKLYEELVTKLARKSQPGLHTYGMFLGTQVAFEHTQMADKFLYEVELRTGTGAHFRYAQHLAQAAELYFEFQPETRPYIKIGEAEPE